MPFPFMTLSTPSFFVIPGFCHYPDAVSIPENILPNKDAMRPSPILVRGRLPVNTVLPQISFLSTPVPSKGFNKSHTETVSGLLSWPPGLFILNLLPVKALPYHLCLPRPFVFPADRCRPFHSFVWIKRISLIQSFDNIHFYVIIIVFQDTIKLFCVDFYSLVH